MPNSEWTDWANIRRGVEEVLQRRLSEARQHHHRAVEDALRRLAEIRLPDSTAESPGSDIAGVLQLLSRLHGRQCIILITDGADTHYKTALPPVPAPADEVRVLVLLTPSRPKDTKLTLGKDLPGAEQFELRSAALKAAAPWVVVVPFVTIDRLDLLPPAPSDERRATPPDAS